MLPRSRKCKCLNAAWDGNTDSCIPVPCRLLIYGQYCSHMEHAQKTLDDLVATREEVKCKVEVSSLTLARPPSAPIKLISFISSPELHTSLFSINQWS